jgi:SET domain-containing protein
MHSHYPIEIKESHVHQRGVFATKNIKKGDLIELIPVIYDINKEDVKNTSVLTNYLFTKNDKMILLLGYGSLYNHSDEHNAEWNIYNDNMAILYALKDIPIGHEIYVNYGNTFWNSAERTKIIK